MARTLTWSNKKFEDLSLQELYDQMALRQEVFVVEQDCPYLDADGKDQKSWHLMGYLGDELATYARLVYPGVSYQEASIGRIVTSLKYRRQGFGVKLMEQLLIEIEQIYGQVPLRMSAQTYLIPFYNSFGFQEVGEGYLEDGLPHIQMFRPAQST